MYNVINMPDLIVRYFSSNPWLVICIVSIAYLFIRINAMKKRAMLIAIIVFFLFVNAFVIKMFTNLGQNSTYYRHLWAIPSIIIIGIAIIDIICILPKLYLRIPVIVLFAITLWFINSQEYIRCRIQIFSTDAKLVQNDTVELGDGLEKIWKESNKNTLFIICPTGYSIPYGNMCSELGLYCGFLTIFDSSNLNDESHNGETELVGGNPDIDFVMSTCCSKGMDYVIVSRSSEDKYKAKGFYPALRTENYLVYNCYGYAGFTRDLTLHGMLSWKASYNEEGEPTINKYGYHLILYEYDNMDRRIAENFSDVSGKQINNIDGYARCTWEYRNNKLVAFRMFDVDGNPSNRKGYGYSTIYYKYDNEGQLVETEYYDKNGNSVYFDGLSP